VLAKGSPVITAVKGGLHWMTYPLPANLP